MGILINLPLTLCTLYLFISFSSVVNASRRPWTAVDNSGAGTRRARAVNRPVPIDCLQGRWSPWSPCTSCTDKKFRFRYLEKPSQFGGTECADPKLLEDLPCPTASGQCLVPDFCGESFTCNETGRCISQSLRCNGEFDCDDSSDEDDCVSVNERKDKCSTLMPIPGAERGTQGYNVLTGEFVDHVIDPKYFGGECEYVYNGEWMKLTYDSFCENLGYNEDEKNYRKPYNYHIYRFVAEATSEGSEEYYEDMNSMLKARKVMGSVNAGVSLGINYVEVGLKASAEFEFLWNISQHTNQEFGFIRLSSKVQTAHFKMRSNKVMLHEDFYISLMELPEQYDFGMYSRFFKTFGTHYVTEGTMGGTLEYVVVVNKTAMAESSLSAHQVGGCVGASIGINYPVSDELKVSAKVGVNPCRKKGQVNQGIIKGSCMGTSQEPSMVLVGIFTSKGVPEFLITPHQFELEFIGFIYRSSKSGVVVDIVTLVKGGILESSAGLLAIRSPDTYKAWGASLKNNPTVIEFEIMPIYELVRISTAADHVGARLANLQRGLDEYLQHFDSCHCAPCRNNGIPVLTGTSCKCNCKSGYEGAACEETLRGDTRIDGLWSCWGAWSSCASGRKTRRRTCNNPAPQGGGATCLGSSSQTQRC